MSKNAKQNKNKPIRNIDNLLDNNNESKKHKSVSRKENNKEKDQ